MKPKDQATEITRLRAEVAAALSQHAPNAAQLSVALEQVDKLLDEARKELASAVHELQVLMNTEPTDGSSEQQRASPIPFRGSRFFFPW